MRYSKIIFFASLRMTDHLRAIEKRKAGSIWTGFLMIIKWCAQRTLPCSFGVWRILDTMLYSGYKEQFERLGRWLEKIRNHDVDTIIHLDFMWAYFQNCWHLKDWIVNDDTVPEAIKGPKNKKGYYDEFEDKLKKYENIIICADLANRSKHLTLNSPKEANATVGSIGIIIKVGSPDGTEPTTTVQRYNIFGKSGALGDGVEIAEKAFLEWKSIIQKIEKGDNDF